MSRYVFDNAAPQTTQRFASLETLFDPETCRRLAALEVGAGWRCLEVGGGGGSVARWLSERVGSTGRVLVTDIDTGFLAALARPNLEVRLHDIVADPLPHEAFDLVHARLVLSHLPRREAALANMVAALRPGGWALLEDFDNVLVDQCPSGSAAVAALFEKVRGAQRQVMRAHGVDQAYARTLDTALQRHGLVDIALDGQVSRFRGGSPGARLIRANLEQTSAEMAAAELATAEEIAAVCQLLEAPDFAFFSSVFFSARGRRP